MCEAPRASGSGSVSLHVTLTPTDVSSQAETADWTGQRHTTGQAHTPTNWLSSGANVILYANTSHLDIPASASHHHIELSYSPALSVSACLEMSHYVRCLLE